MPQTQAWVLWGSDHAAVAIGLIGALGVLLLSAPHLRGLEDRAFRRVVAAALLLNEVAALVIAFAQGSARVPLQLCDLALFLTVWALWSAPPLVSELAYFWGLAGSVQAIATPDVRWGFPDYWWIKFFITHGGIVLGVSYLAMTGRVAATHRSVWRVWLIGNGYVALAGAINALCGTNYGYLAHKPTQPSVLDVCGPWPYYIVVMEAIGLASFYLAYAPFAVARRCADVQGRR